MPLTRFKLSSIGDEGITNAKLADSAVNTEELADGSVTLAKTDNLFENTEFTGDDGIVVPKGTTAERPVSPTVGEVRFNTTIDQLEQYTNDSGWQGISAPPTITSVDVDNFDASDDPQTLVITGQHFDSIASAVLINSSGTTVSPTTSTRNSSSQITIVFSGGDTITTDNGPYDVKVINGSGITAILEDALFLDDLPVWSTSAGTLATLYEPSEEESIIGYGTYDSNNISASSNYSGRTPTNIFGGLYGGSDGWGNDTGLEAWIKYDMGASVQVTRIAYYNYDGQADKIGDFLEASNDDSNWTQISSYGPVSNNSDVSIQVSSITSTKYRYWRIRRTWSQGNWGILSGLQINYYPATTSESTVSETVTATDPEGGTVTYSLTSGALPSDISFSGNTVSGSLDNYNTGYNSSGVQNNFTITANDGTGNTTPRTFNIVQSWKDGSTAARAAINADEIYNMTSATSSDDGVYWIKPVGRSAIQMYCEFNSFGGWMLYAKGEASGTPFPTGTGATGSYISLDGNKGKHSDDDINAINWKYCWLGMSNNNSQNLMDANRQLFTTNGLKFRSIWLRASGEWTGGNTGNGRNQTWSYKGIGGAGGSSLTGSSRQNGTVINANGSTDRTINNTNTYGIAPHDPSIGGAWIFAGDGTTGGAFFNNGFDQDYDNVSWTQRRSFWFMK